MVSVDLPTFSLTEQWRLPSTIRRLRLDLFHSPYYIKPYLLPSPSLVTIYDLVPKLYPQYTPSLWRRSIFEVAIRLAVASARRVICLSQSARDDLVRLLGVAPSKVSVTPAGVDERFQPLGGEVVVRLRQSHGLPQGYILNVGINKPHKNLVRLVEAFAKVKTGRKLVLAGREDPRYRGAQEVVERLGLQERVVFLGEVPEEELPALYNGAMLFIFPSLYEGFGLPVLEAMACGVPVVCSNSSSLPEIAGQAALMVDPFDVDALSKAIERVLQDDALRITMREEGLKRAAQFPWERTARETLAAYSEALKR